jgi:hypothetical protein
VERCLASSVAKAMEDKCEAALHGAQALLAPGFWLLTPIL